MSMTTEMIDRLNGDIKEAMKAGQKARLDAVRYLKSLMMENKTSKSPIDELEVLVKHVKKLRESMEMYAAGTEMHEKLQVEVGFLMAYMPAQMTEEEVKTILKKIVAGLEKPVLGLIMKELSPQIKGKFDPKRANELVREILG